MGVKLHISQYELPIEFEHHKLIKSTYGVSQTVYFLDNLYVIKIFDKNSLQLVENELELLGILQHLNVSKAFSKIYYIKQHPSLIYYKSKGCVLKVITSEHISQIGHFLYSLHKVTTNLSNSNPQLFTNDRVYSLVLQTKNQEFLNMFNSIKIDLQDNGIIHGDLFVDNCSFYNNKLEIVYDWCEACVGDFIFDLAVVAISWCKTKEDIDTLLKAYHYQGSIEEFYSYIKYASLYYILIRYLDRRDYSDLLDLFYNTINLSTR